jgi:DNA/RNA endonuclease YhcR with UshA esterase domain
MKTPTACIHHCTVLATIFSLFCAFSLWATEEIPTIAWDDQAGLEENIGNEVIVSGTIQNIGDYEGNITFLNFGRAREAFKAVVFKKNYDAFPDGFDHYRGRMVNVRGVLKMYRNEQPQIELDSPEQITFDGEE